MRPYSDADLALAWRILAAIKERAGSDVPEWFANPGGAFARLAADDIATLIAEHRYAQCHDLGDQ